MNSAPSNNFDALRIVGALAVLISHSWPIGFGAPDPLVNGISLGTLGVYIFFCISGILISASAHRSESWAAFFWNRFLRIYPGLAVCVLLCFVLLALASSRTPAAYFSDPLAWRFLLNITAVNLEAELPGVFQDNPMSTVNGSLWTLRYEIGCYIFAWVLVGWLARRHLTQTLWGAALVLLVLRVAVAQGWLHAPDAALRAIKLFTPFILGMMIWHFRLPSRPRQPLIALSLLAIAAAAVLGGVQVLYRDLLMSVAMCGLVVVVAYHPRRVRLTPASWGDVSYGLYIYAFPIQQALHGVMTPSSQPAVYIVLAAALTTVAGMLSWRLVEKPALAMKKSAPRTGVLPNGSKLK